MLASLRAASPAATIDWLVEEGCEDAVRAHPALSRVVVFPRGRVGLRGLARAGGVGALRGLLRDLRAPGYDLVVDCQGLGRSGFFAWWTGAPRRIGFANARELGWLGVNDRHHVSRALHTVDRMLGLLEAAGIPPVRDLRLFAPAADRARASAEFGDDRLAVLAPTSAWPGKCWPAERYAELAEALLDAGPVDRIAIVGAGGERGQCGPLLALAARDARVRDLVGATSVGMLMALIERASLVVANDSAAVHMAVGFDRPLVALFGPTRIDLVGPYGRDADVIQAVTPAGGNRHKDEAAGRAAMALIPVRRVIEACLARLGAPAGAGGARA